MSVLKTEVELLRRVSFFAGMDTTRLKLLAFTSDVITYDASQIMFRQGDVGDSAYVILEGEAEARVRLSNGNDVPVARIRTGDLVGEIAVLCDIPRTATVSAVSAVKALRIQREPFFELMHQFPEIAISIARVMAERVAQTTSDLVHVKEKLAAETAR